MMIGDGRIEKRSITFKSMWAAPGIAFLKLQEMSVAGVGIQGDERQEARLQMHSGRA